MSTSSIIGHFNPCNPRIHALQDYKKISKKAEKMRILVLTSLVAIATLGIGMTPIFRYLVGRVKKESCRSKIEEILRGDQASRKRSGDKKCDSRASEELPPPNNSTNDPTNNGHRIDILAMIDAQIAEILDRYQYASVAVPDCNQKEDLIKVIFLMEPTAVWGKPLPDSEERWELLYELLERLDEKTINTHFQYGIGMGIDMSHLLDFAIQEMPNQIQREKVVDILLKKGADVYNKVGNYRPQFILSVADRKAPTLLPRLEEAAENMRERLYGEIAAHAIPLLEELDEEERFHTAILLIYHYSNDQGEGAFSTQNVIWLSKLFELLKSLPDYISTPFGHDQKADFLSFVMSHRKILPLHKSVLVELLVLKGARITIGHINIANDVPECFPFLCTPL